MEDLQESISQRIKLVIDQFANGVQRQFAATVGINPTTISEILGKRRNMPSVDLLYKIAIAYPQLRTEWLLSGNGAMLKSGEPSDRYILDDVYDDMIRPRAKDKIVPLTSDEVAERPDPEPAWLAELDIRLRNMSSEARGNRNTQRLQELVREAYEIVTPQIMDRNNSDSMPHWITIILTHDWDYPFSANANAALSVIRSNYINLYPQYPFLHYFIDFADPYQRIAVFIEEQESPWKPEDIEYQDKLLIIHGWKIFRVPHKIARTYEADILPAHLRNAYAAMLEGRASDEIIIERRSWDEKLRRTTIDGFFKWLKFDYSARNNDF